MSTNSAYVKTIDKDSQQEVDTLLVADNILYITEVTEGTSEIHLTNNEILYCNQSIKFLNSILFLREHTKKRLGDPKW